MSKNEPGKKKLLFIMNNMNGGGAEKSLLSLLQTIDYGRYEVDLFLFKHQGLFMDKLPSQVKLLAPPPLYPYFDMPIGRAMLNMAKRGRPRLAWARLRAGLIFRSEGNPARCEQRVWRHLSRALPRLAGTYDAAIGYLEKNPIYYCIEKVKAMNKIGWIHTDYDRLGMDPSLDGGYFERLNALVTVSDQCAHTLRRLFERQTDKIHVIHNIVSSAAVQEMALEGESADPFGRSDGETVLLSVGRLHPLKGFELAIEACAELVSKGIDVSWHVIGEGSDRQRLEAMIAERGLEGRFKLHGLHGNPYPYIRQADIYVQPSRFEGKSIAVDEAKILGKPIVLTDYSTARDQIRHGEDGWIVPMDAGSLAEGIRRLIEDPPLCRRLAAASAASLTGTEAEIEKLYALL